MSKSEMVAVEQVVLIDELRAENARLDAALADTAAQLTDAVREVDRLRQELESVDKTRQELIRVVAQLRQERDEARELVYQVACSFNTEATLSLSGWELVHNTGTIKRTSGE